MLQTKMKGNLTEWEEQYILHSLSELKLNYINEKKKKEVETDSENNKSDNDIKAKKDAKPKAKSSSKSKTAKKSNKK